MSNILTIDHDPQEPPRSTALTPLDMLDRAVASGADVVTLERLMALHERWEASNARKAFNQAIAAAKGAIPAIFKDKLVDFTGKTGMRTTYRHETLTQIAKVVDPILNSHGLSYRFRSAQENGRVRVTCILSHVDGYSEETTLKASEDHSGNKNSIQAIGSTATFLQRYTLKLALGLATTNDDDGKAAGGDGVITDEQAAEIRGLLTETKSNLDLFLKLFNAESVPDLRASQYADAKALLLRKKAKQEAAQ